MQTAHDRNSIKLNLLNYMPKIELSDAIALNASNSPAASTGVKYVNNS